MSLHYIFQYQSGTKIVEKSVDFIQNQGSDIMLCNINPFSLQQLNTTISITVQSIHCQFKK